ncbi:NAD(P)/FAD-dependent oxidoreductase [Candidatus Phycosocius spiralis]|uniref:Thiamine biosynthesis oxidoreductase ThiO n=1 Tax=Candidatus Phycosocius spiralis TaxID=2815099 RepID=A0ABQ4PSR6_9PROT|nr:FAD-dependent oxidoreductase [Candidatus Phycosocius spiralis]GIU66044.1 putative thiamine biosynthesis oxidoreductase ThiO [Candidatus Phycosocius spiralis]
MAYCSSRHVLIIGAGPVGLCTGLELRRLGFKVTIIDAGIRGAGWASGGMLAPLYEFVAEPDMPPILVNFALKSALLWQTLASDLNVALQTGMIIVARDRREQAHLDWLSTQAQALNYPMQAIAVPDFLLGCGAYSAKDEASLDPRTVLRLLKLAFLERGGICVKGMAAAISTQGVTLTDGTFVGGDLIIVANGYAGSCFGFSISELNSLRPVKGQMARVGKQADFKGAIRAGRLYLLAREDTIVIGATSDQNACVTDEIDLEPLADLLQEATHLLPNLSQCPVIEAWSGIRPDTPDHRPLVGPTRCDGVYLASGTYRNGWLLAPAIAQLLGAQLVEHDIDFALQSLLAPSRFLFDR